MRTTLRFSSLDPVVRTTLNLPYCTVPDFYGGGAQGVMGAAASGAHEAGARVTGVIPEKLRDSEGVFERCDEVIVTRDLRDGLAHACAHGVGVFALAAEHGHGDRAAVVRAAAEVVAEQPRAVKIVVKRRRLAEGGLQRELRRERLAQAGLALFRRAELRAQQHLRRGHRELHAHARLRRRHVLRCAVVGGRDGREVRRQDLRRDGGHALGRVLTHGAQHHV